MDASPCSPAPLRGVRVLEFAGLGPAPYGCMLLADLGADVLRIERAKAEALFPSSRAPIDRGRRAVMLDLKDTDSLAACLKLVDRSDVLVEGFRPGVMERLGLGPEPALARNGRLIYARMTGWGQSGPLAMTAGHDITYLALTGALHAMGPADGVPVAPLNVVGDMGGGGAFLVIGVLAALLERERSGRGQVIDAAILDGTVSQLAIILGLAANGGWDRPRGLNILDGGAPFYRTYRCADGQFVAVGALEPKFFVELILGLGLDAVTYSTRQYDRSTWPSLHKEFQTIFATRSRDEWAARFGNTDACVAPVLTFEEAARHPHNAQRSTYVVQNGVLEPPAAPRFSRSAAVAAKHVRTPNMSIEEALEAWTTGG